MTTTITNGDYVRHCSDPYEVWRAETMFTKEPGTIAWLSGLKTGETFFDIGANIGIYTDIASRQVGPTGRVYAFEPHVGNAAALMRHVVEAGLTNVTLLTCALHSEESVQPFHYASVRSGSSGSQFSHRNDEHGQKFESLCVEVKHATAIDTLLHWLRVAHMVKIDVDGNEVSILQGMMQWLRGSFAPRSVQVETRPSNREAVRSYMVSAKYAIDHVHHTAHGLKAIEQGAYADTLPNNTVFVKA